MQIIGNLSPQESVFSNQDVMGVITSHLLAERSTACERGEAFDDRAIVGLERVNRVCKDVLFKQPIWSLWLKEIGISLDRFSGRGTVEDKRLFSQYVRSFGLSTIFTSLKIIHALPPFNSFATVMHYLRCEVPNWYICRINAISQQVFINPYIVSYRNPWDWISYLLLVQDERAAFGAYEMGHVMRLNHSASSGVGARLLELLVIEANPLKKSHFDLAFNCFLDALPPDQRAAIFEDTYEIFCRQHNKTDNEMIDLLMRHNGYSALKELMYQHDLWDHVTDKGETALHRAVLLGFSWVEKIVGYYVEFDCLQDAINETDQHERTALHLAIEKCDICSTRLLLQYGADPLIQDNVYYNHAFFQLCNIVDEEAVEGLCDVLLESPAISIDMQDHCGDTILHQMGMVNHYSGMQVVLDRGACVNKQNHRGETALMQALLSDDDIAVEMILSDTSNMRLVSVWGGTLLMYAIWGRYTLTERIIAPHFEDPLLINQRSTSYGINWELLLAEIREKNGQFVELDCFYERPNTCDEEGLTALHIAVALENVDMVRWLLAHGARVDRCIERRDSTGGVTPLHIASAIGHQTIKKLLLEAPGADQIADIRDFDGRTAAQREERQRKREREGP